MTGTPTATRELTPEPIAHVTSAGTPHLLRDHLVGVAELSRAFASRFGAGDWAALSGRWHDLGKFAANFQNTIRRENGFAVSHNDIPGAPREHSTAGAVHACQKLGALGIPLAYVIAGHHGGLSDHLDLKGRLQKSQLLQHALGGLPPAEVLALVSVSLPFATDGDGALRLEMWIRMLFSALCDADFLDTEAFYDPIQAASRRAATPIAELTARLDAHLGRLQQAAGATEVNRVRDEVLAACRGSAAHKPGVFSLTVPTGGGKTLSSLAFALRHAMAHDLDRVIVAIPFTSIIEQTAEVFRSALGADAVLEHHSALDPDDESPQNRLASENWDASVVVTTTVQLFESLFANRPSACRKLHRLARSVIILDEAQTLPTGLLHPVLHGLQSLVADFGASVVICTATQPAFGRSATVPFGFPEVREIVPTEVRAFERLQRVRTRWPSRAEAITFEELSHELAAEKDVLAIVHRRADAHELCGLLDALLQDCSTIHLSALMCAEHRSAAIQSIKQRKRAGEPLRVVSTQLVEAGVDLDFRVVYRALAGLDALAQAAGRCNREGLLATLGELRVFLSPTAPPMGVPRTALGVTQALLAADPELDLFSPDSYRSYFQQLYGAFGRNLDSKDVQGSRRALNFKTTAGRVQLIEDGWSAPLVVPYPGASAAVAALEVAGPSRDRLRALQRYTVNVACQDRDRWLKAGWVRLVHETVAVLDGLYGNAYDARFGLLPGRVGTATAGSLIIDD